MPLHSRFKVDKVTRGDAGRGCQISKVGPPPEEYILIGLTSDEYDDLRSALLHGKDVSVEYTESGEPPTKDVTSVTIHG